MGALYIFIIMLMRVLQSLYSKKAAMALPDSLKPYITYVGISKIFSAAFAVAIILPTMSFSGINGQAVAIAACSGISLAICSLCGIKALTGGTIALNSIFGTAGMIIPIILGVIFFEEKISLLQIVAIVVLFFAIWLMISSEKDTFKGFSLKTLLYLTGTFVTNGLVMFCQKLFGELQPDGNVSMFSMLTFLIPGVVLLVMRMFMSVPDASKGQTEKLGKDVIIYAAVLAFAVFVIQQLVTILTPVISSAVLFALVNGGATVIAAIVGAVVYKEKITKKSGMGVVIGICALVCIKVFE